LGAPSNLSSVFDRPAHQKRSGSGERTTFGIATALLVADVALFAAVREPATETDCAYSTVRIASLGSEEPGMGALIDHSFVLGPDRPLAREHRDALPGEGLRAR
jgi:hypothetical protein